MLADVNRVVGSIWAKSEGSSLESYSVSWSAEAVFVWLMVHLSNTPAFTRGGLVVPV